jgi:hypothetical protein
VIPYLLDKVWIVPAIMAASFLVILFFGKRLGTRATAGIGIASVSLCLLFSVVVAGQWISRVDHPPTGEKLAEDIRQANGLTPQTPEEIEAEIELKREQLAGTIDALATKLDVKSQAQAKVAGVKADARANPDLVAAGAAVVAMVVTALLLRSRG